MHNQESGRDNEMHKGLWDFDIEMDHQLLTRHPEKEIVNKKRELVYSAIRADHRVKKKKAKYVDLARELKNYGT